MIETMHAPALPESVAGHVSSVLSTWLASCDWHFYASGRPVAPDQVAGQDAFLPVILWQVEKMMRRVMVNETTGLSYVADPSNVVGARVVLPPAAGRPRSPLYLWSMEVLAQAREAHPMLDGASVDHLVEDFYADHERGLVPWAAGSEPAGPDLSAPRLE